MTGSAAAIIAGGRGTRLGGLAKGLITVDGQRIIDRQRQALQAVFAHVVVIANDPVVWRDIGLPVVADRVADAGPLAGIDAALAALADRATDVVCVAADMPFLESDLLRLLRDHAPGADAVVPRVAGNPEPLLARYAVRLSPMIAAQLGSGDFAVHRFLRRLPVIWLDEPALRAVDPSLRSFTNVNTPADWKAAEAVDRR
ncbi:MAG: molybdenum cofactor guanylyltransferase [Myxococcales bacterium]|jgi:molybdopterin-guanine dinucleotide biosynthesis protein A|nr:molybdenum cofactor guanylyltransferase [Myxococcales bacterium]